MTLPALGIIGGSGLYALEDLDEVRELTIDTPFGPPSAPIVEGRLGSTRMLFLPRHGTGHRFPPHRINYRANVLALKLAGAGQIVSVSAVGSMKESIEPGHMVIVDQFIDRTRHRQDTFFDEPGVVAHVAFADPVDPMLSNALYEAARASGATVHRGGTYLCIEGPQFATRAESLLYRSFGVDVIGMTNLPEARLAREAELPYATIAMATDYDCWHADHADVSVDAILKVMRENVEIAKTILARLAPILPDPRMSPASQALATSILSDLSAAPVSVRKKLLPLIGKYLPKH